MELSPFVAHNYERRVNFALHMINESYIVGDIVGSGRGSMTICYHDSSSYENPINSDELDKPSLGQFHH